MYSPLAIANYFINKSLATGEKLTPLKLLKLVYLSHGWYLGNTDKPLLGEAVEAWMYGPVIPSVYHAFKNYGRGQITELDYDYRLLTYPQIEDDRIQKFLDRIWDIYGKWTGNQLSTLTHEKDSPWYKAWNDRGSSNEKNKIIPNNDIRDFYYAQLKANKTIA